MKERRFTSFKRLFTASAALAFALALAVVVSLVTPYCESRLALMCLVSALSAVQQQERMGTQLAENSNCYALLIRSRTYS